MKVDQRPTPDQMYLAMKLNEVDLNWEAEEAEDYFVPKQTPPKNRITPAALQKWNLIYGVAAVSDAMRTAWGFRPLGGIENPFAYVQGILRGSR